MNAQKTIKRLRYVAGFAMAGCVIGGAFFGWADLSFDPRVVGASIGGAWAAVKFHLVV